MSRSQGRAEVASAIEEAVAELTPLFGRAAADAVAAANIPRMLAGAIRWRADLQKMETARQSLLAASARPLPADAELASQALARLVRRRIETLTRYPKES